MKTSAIKSITAPALLPFATRAKTTGSPPAVRAPETKMRSRLASTIALAIVGVAALLIPSARATPQSGVSSTTIAQGRFDEIDIFTKTDIDSGVARDYWK